MLCVCLYRMGVMHTNVSVFMSVQVSATVEGIVEVMVAGVYQQASCQECAMVSSLSSHRLILSRSCCLSELL